MTKQTYTFLIVMQNFVGTLNSAFEGPWYAGMPLVLVTVWGGGVVELAAGLGGRDVTCGKRAVALAASIVCGLAWLAFVVLSSGFGSGIVD
jgi:hypothetical protein